MSARPPTPTKPGRGSLARSPTASSAGASSPSTLPPSSAPLSGPWGALLFAFARGAVCKDNQGMLPLHLGFHNGCEGAVVDLLLVAHPQSVNVRARKGRTPMVVAQ